MSQEQSADAGQPVVRGLVGYRVEATDGHVGKVDRHTAGVDERHIVVDTGVWVFGTEVMLPASAVTRVDHAAHTVWVGMSKAEVKQAYRDETAGYYGTGG